MIIWFALAIPVIGAIVKLAFFRKRVLWWEFAIPFVVSIVLLVIAKLTTEWAQTRDIEFHGGFAVDAKYYEDWNELVPCRHPKYREESYTDSEGNPQTTLVFDGYEHPFGDVDYHPPYWTLTDNNAYELRISKGTFESLAKRWGNRNFVELHRDYHSDDGDMYITKWDNRRETLEPVTTEHSYENRVAVSDSIFNFEEVSEEVAKTFALHDYPTLEGYHQRCILGDGGPTTESAERELQIANAELGRPKQVRMYVLLFRDQPLEAALMQEALWKGGNKNEFVLCIGIDSQTKVQWAKAFSWTEVERLKVDAREYLGQTFIDSGKSLDLVNVVQWMSQASNSSFIRKPWEQFDYLSVEPSSGALVLVYLLTILVNIGISAWVILNEFSEDTPIREVWESSRHWRRRRYYH